ncbi:unnamed protein product [Phytophthora fragariaefolia]|uniref:Unnamed protein product n=1 Tax=Phytophthora fragariaefolia TaxID=1490495 RepID=A0A9W6XPW2_9STRA|nr:unnamed protein product [Phytophthora fragariaefolia]
MYERALVRYPQCRSNVFAPSLYDREETACPDSSAAVQAPRATLELDFVYGYRSGAPTSLSSSHSPATNVSTNNNVFYLSTGEIMWFTATLVVLYKKESNTQRYFREHTNEVTSVNVHPNQRIVASGQAGRSAFLLVWNANDVPLGKRFACLKGHQVAVRSINFSHDGKLIVSLGSDMYNTICIHDWKSQELLVSARGHTFRVNIIAFNPFQAYGRPEAHRSKKPGQALHDDDACYTLVSCGVRHIRFWTLTKTESVPPPSQENADSAFYRSTFGGPPRLRPPTPAEKVWKLEGNVPSFHGRFEVQDFTSLAFVSNSPPFYLYDEHLKELIATNVTDHSLGWIVAGTTRGDLCLFVQPRASPNMEIIYEKDLYQEPAKWWEIPDEYTDTEINELVLEKIAFEPTGRLVDVVPHDQETGNRFKLSRQAHAEMEDISKKITLRPNSNMLRSRLSGLQYSGPLAHQGAVYQIAYCKKLNTVMSCGSDGKLLLWACQMIKPMRVPGVNTHGVFTPLTGTFTEGSHALIPLNDPTKVFQLPVLLPNEASAGGAAALPRPTSIVWSEDGNFLLVAASNSCIWELNISTGDWNLIFEARSSAIATCAAHPRLHEVATVSQDGYLCIWNLQQHICSRRLYLGTFITSTAKAFCMEFHPAGHEVVIGLGSGEMLVVDCEALKVLLRKNVKGNPVGTTNMSSGPSGPGFRVIAQVKYCPNGRYLAVGMKDTFVRIYDVANGYKKLHVCEGHSSAIIHLTWNKNGDILQSNAADGEILHWLISPKKGEAKQITDAFLVREVEWIKWTCVFGWPTLGIWSEESPNLADIVAVAATGPKTAIQLSETEVTQATSNEDLIAVACRSTVHLLKYPAHRGAKRKLYKAHSSTIAALGFSFDDAYLVTVGGDDATLMQWKVLHGGDVSPRGDTKIVQNSINGTAKIEFTGDDSIGKPSSPVPPPQHERRLANQHSPRKNSRQYRERQHYQDTGEGELGLDNESMAENADNELGNSMHKASILDESSSLDEHSSSPAAPVHHETRNADQTEPLSVLIQVRVNHSYTAESSEELSINHGEILRVLSKANGEWWLGETCDGSKGYFPASYVEDIDLSALKTSNETAEEQVAEE